MSGPFCLYICGFLLLSLSMAAPAPADLVASGQDLASQPDVVVRRADQESAQGTDNNLMPATRPEPGIALSNRLLLTGTLIGILLGQLSVLFGYLKIDHATRGFYSGRLQSIAAAASIAIFVAGYLFYTNWMS